LIIDSVPIGPQPTTKDAKIKRKINSLCLIIRQLI